MLDLIGKLLNSKAFTVIILIAVLLLMIYIVVLQYQNSHLNDKVDLMQKNLDNKEDVIIELNQEIKMRDFEIQYLRKGQQIADLYEQEKEKALEDDAESKVQAVQTAMSTEEGREWWNTPIPDDILNSIACY